MNALKPLAAFLFFIASPCFGEVPSWSKDPTVQHVSEKVILVNCRGQGLAKDLSYQSALQACNSIAASAFNTTFISKSVVIETEKESPKLHSEITSEAKITGLQPKAEREAWDTLEGGVMTYLQVRYDMAKMKAEAPSESKGEAEEASAKSILSSRELGESSSGIAQKTATVGFSRTYTVLMMPEKCREYLIRGKRPRSYHCESNPMQIMVDVSTDTEIILRPSSNKFLPITLKVRPQRSLASDYDSEVLNATFQRSP